MNKTVIISLTLLVIVVGITAFFNRADIADKQELQENAVIVLTKDGTEIKRYNLNEIQKMGEHTFNKELDTSETEPEDQTFTGVQLKGVLSNAGLEITENQQVIVKAIDGYTVALTRREVLAEDNVYLVYKNDGKYLKGKGEGGTGPYRIVIKEDQFGQRWCKFVTEVGVK